MAVFAPVMVLGPVIVGSPAAWAGVLVALGAGAVVGGVVVAWVRPQRYLVWVVSGALLLLPLPVLLAFHAPLPLLVVGAFVFGVEQSAHWAGAALVLAVALALLASPDVNSPGR
ncbi:hypothetical protein [Actinokineospora cianjurensis]|uniref:Uncharacterized protein n=1 Tax=Actinokineospora cianjurensis TaxID=585224 RepID=A0A421B3U0_9PSEU|nr:hypothetical protein [Actinokineospora cianjurensis]RLK58948.1 hypothetical protein CLV68_3429 [Actinokineospora cianjurensis]